MPKADIARLFDHLVGAALIAVTSASFWYLLPHNGQVYPLVKKFDGGSTITIVVMTLFTFGVVILSAGLFGCA